MTSKKSKPKKAVYLSAAKKDKVVKNRDRWERAVKGEKLSNAILQPLGFNIMLANMIGSHFIRQHQEVKKLTSGINMVQKARLANILGLINKTVFNDLKQIHEIRNKCAHSFEASFAHDEVLKFVKKLSTAKGEEVTTGNSYRFYKRAVLECVDHLNEYWAERNSEG